MPIDIEVKKMCLFHTFLVLHLTFDDLLTTKVYAKSYSYRWKHFKTQNVSNITTNPEHVRQNVTTRLVARRVKI